VASADATPFRAGFVAIVGRPNVGKSTLLNRLLGEHVAIVSARPQTTRTRILGIHNGPGFQMALFDTPGVHRAQGPLNRRMVQTALDVLGEVDVVLVLVEAGTGPDLRVSVGETAEWIAERVRRVGKPAVLGVNKVDRVAKETLLPVIDAYRGLLDWKAVVPFSGLTGEGVDRLVEVLARELPPADAPLFPPDMLTDQAERVIAAEYVREQVMELTREEIPYSVAVEVEEFDESERRDDGGLVRIGVLVWVERASQKAIVIGKGGAMLKRVGTRARQKLERLLGARVFLRITVKVEERWSERVETLRRLGIGS
jgi:GTP-binding protein Era